METQTSVESSLQNLNFEKSSQKKKYIKFFYIKFFISNFLKIFKISSSAMQMQIVDQK